MTRQSIPLMTIFIAALIILSAGIAGCTSPAPSSAVPAVPLAPAQKLSTVPPSEMILQPADVPGNFTLMEKGERTVSDVSDFAIGHGWKGGDYTSYMKNDRNLPSGTVFEQITSVYPAENISLIVPDTISNVKNWSARDTDNRSVEELSLPTIGDSSRALKILDKSENSQEFIIVFVKQDVFEQLYTNGTATDYETLRHLAGIAAAKIR